MKVTLAEIAELVDGEVTGDPTVVVTGLAGVREATGESLTFVSLKKYLPLLDETQAAAAVVARNVSSDKLPLVRVDNPDLAFAVIAEEYVFCPPKLEPGTHPNAVVAVDAVLGKDVVVSAFAVVQSGARIGDRTVLYPGVYVGHDTVIGADCILHPNVVIRESVSVGDRCVFHPGAVIGADGFGYVTVDGVNRKVPQVGTVIIESDVEIGVCSAIDRARVDATIIGQGTKIDNLVQIGHNVHVGRNCMIVSLTGISGSTKLGDGCMMGGQVGLAGHIELSDGVMVAARAGVMNSFPAGTIISGEPAQEHRKTLRLVAAQRKIPALIKQVQELTERIATLEAKAKNPGP